MINEELICEIHRTKYFVFWFLLSPGLRFSLFYRQYSLIGIFHKNMSTIIIFFPIPVIIVPTPAIVALMVGRSCLYIGASLMYSAVCFFFLCLQFFYFIFSFLPKLMYYFFSFFNIYIIKPNFPNQFAFIFNVRHVKFPVVVFPGNTLDTII